MKRDFLKGLNLTDEQIDQIMAEAGKDVESHKGKAAAAEQAAAEAKAQLETVTAQLTEAGKTIEGFKAMDIDGIKKAADDYKAQLEQARKDAETQIEQIRFDHDLQAALKGYNVHDPADVLPHLKRDALKRGENGAFIGLKEQIEPLQTNKPYLFSDAADDPKIVEKSTTTTSSGGVPAWVQAAAKSAGIDPKGM